MIRTAILVVALAFAALPAFAANDTCTELMQGYTLAAKGASLTYEENIGEDAAHKTTRNVELVAEMIARQMNLELMIANKCPLPTEKVIIAPYSTEALKCVLARRTRGPNAPECDYDKWIGK